MRYRIAFLILIMLWAFTACNLAGEPPTQRPSQVTPQTQGRPQVTIVSVTPGQSVGLNQQVILTAAVTDTVGVTRVNLSANGQVADTFSSASSAGETNRTVQLDFTPRTVGVVTLEVVASRLDGTQSEPATTQITVGAAATATRLPGASSTGGTSGGTGGVPANPCLNVSATVCSACISGAAGANLRPAPSTQTTPIRVLPAGTITAITGRTSDNQWWQVREGNGSAWLSATVVTALGICTSVPVVANSGNPTQIVIPSSTPVVLTSTPIPAQPTSTRVPPDLVVASITGAETLQRSGGSVTSTYTIVITNTGGSATGTFSSTLTVLPGNTVTNLAAISSLNAGESITLPTPLTFTGAGTYTLNVRADSGNNVTESFEANNTNSFVVTVTN